MSDPIIEILSNDHDSGEPSSLEYLAKQIRQQLGREFEEKLNAIIQKENNSLEGDGKFARYVRIGLEAGRLCAIDANNEVCQMEES